jgi:RPA family protein
MQRSSLGGVIVLHVETVAGVHDDIKTNNALKPCAETIAKCMHANYRAQEKQKAREIAKARVNNAIANMQSQTHAGMHGVQAIVLSSLHTYYTDGHLHIRCSHTVYCTGVA